LSVAEHAASRDLSSVLRQLGVGLAIMVIPLADAGRAGESQVSGGDFQTQEEVTQLLQKVIQEYWNAGEDKGAAFRAGSSTNVEAAFRRASKLMPERLDLRFGLASSLLGQAIQTNGQPLQVKVQEALGIYLEIEALDANNFEASLLYSAYARAMGDTNGSEESLSRLMVINPRRTSEYVERFGRIERILHTMPNEKPRRTMPKDQHHAIVVLGAGLETNGMLKAKLVSRLDQCRRLARIYPHAPIILTGGNQKSGVTEAFAMDLWCLRRGIPRKRLYLEDRARDTVENALFTSAILQRLGVTHVTLVTSANHMHRGLADLQEACLQRDLKLEYENLAARTKGDRDLDAQQERVGVYKDVLRTSGLWAFPGLQR
jgi:hypothetical protein